MALGMKLFTLECVWIFKKIYIHPVDRLNLNLVLTNRMSSSLRMLGLGLLLVLSFIRMHLPSGTSRILKKMTFPLDNNVGW